MGTILQFFLQLVLKFFVSVGFGFVKVFRKKKLEKDRAYLEKLNAFQDRKEATILYLRDFDVDGLKQVNESFYEFDLEYLERNFETELSLKLSRIGRFVALGAASPQGDIGAQRIVVQDSEWQAKILQLMRKASMIVLRPALSNGLTWEIGQLVQRNYLDKLVLCLEYSKQEKERYNRFRQATHSQFDLPAFEHKHAYIYFNGNRTGMGVSTLEETPLYQELAQRPTARTKAKLLPATDPRQEGKVKSFFVGSFSWVMKLFAFISLLLSEC